MDNFFPNVLKSKNFSHFFCSLCGVCVVGGVCVCVCVCVCVFGDWHIIF